MERINPFHIVVFVRLEYRKRRGHMTSALVESRLLLNARAKTGDKKNNYSMPISIYINIPPFIYLLSLVIQLIRISYNER